MRQSVLWSRAKTEITGNLGRRHEKTLQPVIPGFNRPVPIECRTGRLTGDPGAAGRRERPERGRAIAFASPHRPACLTAARPPCRTDLPSPRQGPLRRDPRAGTPQGSSASIPARTGPRRVSFFLTAPRTPGESRLPGHPPPLKQGATLSCQPGRRWFFRSSSG